MPAYTVYRVDLNGRVGYYRVVFRMTLAGVEKEARRVYPRADIKVTHEPEMTKKQAHELTLATLDT